MPLSPNLLAINYKDFIDLMFKKLTINNAEIKWWHSEL